MYSACRGDYENPFDGEYLDEDEREELEDWEEDEEEPEL